jgi:hypothetical protein
MIRVIVTDEQGSSQSYWKLPEIDWVVELSAVVLLVAGIVLPFCL